MSAPSSKASLRKLMAERLRALPRDEIQRQSESVFKQLIELAQYKRAERISLYLSTEREIDTIKLLRHALEVDRKQCFVPFIGPSEQLANVAAPGARAKPRMQMLRLSSMREYEEMPRNRWGIKEFESATEATDAKEAKEATETTKATEAKGASEGEAQQRRQAAQPPDGLHLIVVPGLAFTRTGHRLGHGRGYYDEFLLDWSARCAPLERARFFTVGLALREQLLDDDQLPRGARDIAVDKVLRA